MIAFLFPGQGSQAAGMGKDLASDFKVARDVFEEANDALGFDLAALCFNGPDEDLQLTENTQPAILTHSVAALRVLQEVSDLRPDYAAGHSLGEYSALVCSGALQFADAVKIVRQRGRFMQQAVPVGQGAMAAIIGLDAESLAQVCRQAADGDVVSPANYNSPGQVVIAGHAEAVARATDLAKAGGAKRAMSLPVSAPFHCSLMQPAADQLARVLEPIQVGELNVPVVSNVEALPNRESERVKDLLVRQVCAPVRWEESVTRMVESGVDHFIEIGPGKVLSGLVKRMARGSRIQNLAVAADIEKLN
ncbi:[acyl-carrier-protein] S-malonyltransferase [Geothermobacter hydrogeniphilus]|uniref:Malonyl CoA-acyl carrier protein transacylase n=1 Tax=Geothermobacter hydrogeniphilus TaxID=1969733 RepID=A0A2K2H8C5_9BACT|nr:ACP S-malonyltransferase [Geothermobacter hydrogeniphilus]PNU19558.1 [acyl-carrier-protein] S-malonyltransferase [Geothermobacter hydrogeniphilus]